MLMQEGRNPEGKGTDTVQRHITLLHEYNEVRDVGMGLMGIVAERRGVGVRCPFYPPTLLEVERRG